MAAPRDNSGVYALCLCRGGSKGVPKKNIRILSGKPLLQWCMGAASESGVFERSFVSTDCPDIARVATNAGFEVHQRDPATASDGATSESGIVDFLAAHPECTTLCLLQATSPLTTADDLRAAHAQFTTGEADSLVTVVRQHRFLWTVDAATGLATPQNYDPVSRPLRQNWSGELMENGAFYFFRRAAFDASGSRLSGTSGNSSSIRCQQHDTMGPHPPARAVDTTLTRQWRPSKNRTAAMPIPRRAHRSTPQLTYYCGYTTPHVYSPALPTQARW